MHQRDIVVTAKGAFVFNLLRLNCWRELARLQSWELWNDDNSLEIESPSTEWK